MPVLLKGEQKLIHPLEIALALSVNKKREALVYCMLYAIQNNDNPTFKRRFKIVSHARKIQPSSSTIMRPGPINLIRHSATCKLNGSNGKV